MKTLNLILSLSVAGLAIATAGCGSGLSSGNTDNSSSTTFTQIERLARPAVNEGLVLSNANLNAFNSIPPSLDLTSSIPAVAAVLTEATAVLTIVTNLEGTAVGGANDPTAGDVAGQFLPDVMRVSVDTADIVTITALASRTANQTFAQSAYAGCVSATGGGEPLLCGGRKIRDDVIDITLTYIAVGADGLGDPNFVGDDIGYDAGHGTLLGAFPFLARPM